MMRAIAYKERKSPSTRNYYTRTRLYFPAARYATITITLNTYIHNNYIIYIYPLNTIILVSPLYAIIL